MVFFSPGSRIFLTFSGHHSGWADGSTNEFTDRSSEEAGNRSFSGGVPSFMSHSTSLPSLLSRCGEESRESRLISFQGMGSFWSLRDSEERSNSVRDGNRDTSSIHSYLPLRNENSTANGFQKSRAKSFPIKVSLTYRVRWKEKVYIRRAAVVKRFL